MYECSSNWKKKGEVIGFVRTRPLRKRIDHPRWDCSGKRLEKEFQPHPSKRLFYSYSISPASLPGKERTRIRFNILYNFIANHLIYVRSH